MLFGQSEASKSINQFLESFKLFIKVTVSLLMTSDVNKVDDLIVLPKEMYGIT